MKILLFIFLFIFYSNSYAQRAVQGLPIDNKGTPLIAGLGLPSMCEVAVSAATYTAFCQLPTNTGDNTGRMFRHIQVFNPSATNSVYVCLGNNTSCATDMIKIRPGAAISQDFALYGPGNLVTRVWLRETSTESLTVDVMSW